MSAVDQLKTQLLKDTRLLWLPLVLFGLLLAHAVAVRMSPTLGTGLFAPLPQLQIVIVAALTASLLLQEPLRGADAFWRTRPVPRTVLLSAKGIWWCLFVLFPCLVVQSVVLSGLELEPSIWLRLLGMTLLGLVMMGSASALIALVCRSQVDFWLSFAGIGIAFFIAVAVWAGPVSEEGPQPLARTGTGWGLGLALLLAGLAIAGRYLRLSTGRYAIVALASLLALSYAYGGERASRRGVPRTETSPPVLSISPLAGDREAGEELELAFIVALEEGDPEVLYEVRHLSAKLLLDDGRKIEGHLLGRTDGKLELAPRPLPWPLADTERQRDLRLTWVPSSPLPPPSSPATLALDLELAAESRPEVRVVPLRPGAGHHTPLERITLLGVEAERHGVAIVLDEFRIVSKLRRPAWRPCTLQQLLIHRPSSEVQHLQGLGSLAEIDSQLPLPFAPPLSLRSRHRYRYRFIAQDDSCHRLRAGVVARATSPPPDWLHRAELIRLRSEVLGHFDLEQIAGGHTVGDWILQPRAELGDGPVAPDEAPSHPLERQ